MKLLVFGVIGAESLNLKRLHQLLVNYAKPIVAELRANMVRVDADFSATPFNSDRSRAGAKIPTRNESECFPPSHIGGYGSSSAVAITPCGTGAASVRPHHGGPQGPKPKRVVVADILASIRERRA